MRDPQCRPFWRLITRLAELGGWDVAELWTGSDRLFAVFGLVAAEPAQGS